MLFNKIQKDGVYLHSSNSESQSILQWASEIPHYPYLLQHLPVGQTVLVKTLNILPRLYSHFIIHYLMEFHFFFNLYLLKAQLNILLEIHFHFYIHNFYIQS